MILLGVALLTPFLVGGAFLAAVGLRPNLDRRSMALCVPIALLIGLAFGSVGYFAVSRFREPTSTIQVFLELVLVSLFSLLAFLMRSRAVPLSPMGALPPERSARVISGIVGLIALSALASVLGYIIAHAIRYPHGGMDAVGFWYFRARMLFLSEDRWEAVFGMMGHFRPDHPIMLTTSVVRCWILVGEESQSVYLILGLMFTIGVASVVYGILGVLRNPLVANWGVVLLFLPPSMVGNAGLLMSDVLFSFILVSVFSCFLLGSRVEDGKWRLCFMTGFLLGIAAWTKNEGMVWNLAFHMGMAGVGWWRGRLSEHARMQGCILLASLPFILAEMWFKSLVPFEDITCLVPAFPADGVLKVFNITRDFEIFERMLGGTLKFLSWGLLLLPAFLFVGGIKEGIPERESLYGMLGVFFFAILGYGAAFVATPNPVEFQISFSIDRICVHFWPSLLVTLLMFSKTGFADGSDDPLQASRNSIQ